jgi:DNA-directed RNA polymerase specialized sigma24 family protein
VSKRRANYSLAEVQGLIEEYDVRLERLSTHPAGLPNLVRIADLDIALGKLADKYWGVVLLHGLMGYTQQEVGRFLQISQQAVAKRYRQGVEELHHYVNGGE